MLTASLVALVSPSTKTPVLYPCRDVAAFTRDQDGGILLVAGFDGQYRFIYPKR